MSAWIASCRPTAADESEISDGVAASRQFGSVWLVSLRWVRLRPYVCEVFNTLTDRACARVCNCAVDRQGSVIISTTVVFVYVRARIRLSVRRAFDPAVFGRRYPVCQR